MYLNTLNNNKYIQMSVNTFNARSQNSTAPNFFTKFDLITIISMLTTSKGSKVKQKKERIF